MLETLLILALSGGITSGIITYIPALKALKKIEKETNITHSFIEYPYSSFIVWVILATISLPFVLPSFFSEKVNNKSILSITKRKVA